MTCDPDNCSERASQLRTVLWSLRQLLVREQQPTLRERFELRELANLGIDLATQLRGELGEARAIPAASARPEA